MRTFSIIAVGVQGYTQIEQTAREIHIDTNGVLKFYDAKDRIVRALNMGVWADVADVTVEAKEVEDENATG